MKILIYATTFGADLLSFTKYLKDNTDTEVKVLLEDVDKFKAEGIFDFWDLDIELHNTNNITLLRGIKGFTPDVTIMDNNIPLRKLSPKALILWHGYGWKGPNDEEEFKWIHRNLRLTWGNMKEPNEDIKWQCFGPVDYKHRSEVSGFHPKNCLQLGSASHDYLQQEVPKEDLQPYYPFDVVNKKTVLIAPTWHYGEIFSHWGDEDQLFNKLLTDLKERDVNVILRLHDSFRFEHHYLEFLQNLETKYDNILLKFKDHHPDNFLDLQVADLLMTNFSSIANLFYATGRPTVHIYPVKSKDESFMWLNKTLFGIKKKKVDSIKFIWKYPPEDNGGMLARSFEEMMEQVKTGLENPDCCKEEAQEYLDKHMMSADGKNCERIWNAINELVDN
ncbi:CDP-glycerol glycerophosphotransferase family protein [Gracilimonas mengyeensis]|uniref:CDP-Glycerol:Poly(Glycerophosphate) glycerophosphotransferase n=1 Tax=Gracilimonas mengyeensis TaxID=1302730 RepID=A0A521AEP2_9BACT|nr:CDP-glycerol glycerophosphotransferase family protein [Gracilimonas mengyeensis]SMO33180.1 CDP-Glycerol:Poly(glycerophosphate) glycerophosphotransferase [Gracilimonas mengyeensis]